MGSALVRGSRFFGDVRDRVPRGALVAGMVLAIAGCGAGDAQPLAEPADSGSGSASVPQDPEAATIESPPPEWAEEGARVMAAKAEALKDMPFDSLEQEILVFAAQSLPIDVMEPGEYLLTFPLPDSAIQSDGEVVDGFAINAPTNFENMYDFGEMERDRAAMELRIWLIVPDQVEFQPYKGLTFWIY